jgi:hypothetical protein
MIRTGVKSVMVNGAAGLILLEHGGPLAVWGITVA